MRHDKMSRRFRIAIEDIKTLPKIQILFIKLTSFANPHIEYRHIASTHCRTFEPLNAACGVDLSRRSSIERRRACHGIAPRVTPGPGIQPIN